LDAARPGDVILLDPGTTYTGNFVLPAKDGDEYITVQTAIDAERIGSGNGRVTPSDAPLLAKIVSPNSAPAVRTGAGAHHWRLTLLEIAGNGGGDLVRLGDSGAAQNRLEQVPHHLVLDRCYIHGDPKNGQKRGVTLNSASTSLVNSYVSDIGLRGQETQAAGGWNGPGPFLIENNYLEAAGVNVMFGGTDPSIRGIVPADIQIRRNHFSKKLTWRNGPWVVKNLFELKNARRVTVEWNLFEHNWLHAQQGYAILLKSWNQDGGAPWSIVEDVVVRHNIIRHVASAFNILGRSYDKPAELARRISIEDNLAYDVSARNWGGHGRFLVVGDGAADVTVDHNTVVQEGTFMQVYGSAQGRPLPMHGMRITNNMALHNDYGIKGDGTGVGNDTLAAYMPGAIFTRNVLAGGSGRQYPGGNEFPDVSTFFGEFRSVAENDFRLKPESAFVRGATDGGALGANVEQLLRCVASMVPTSTSRLRGAAPQVRITVSEPEPGPEPPPNPRGSCPSAGSLE
jgi:hypothetical protein